MIIGSMFAINVHLGDADLRPQVYLMVHKAYNHNEDTDYNNKVRMLAL